MKKHILFDPNTREIVLVNTYRSRREGRWIAWIPATISREKNEWLRMFAARLREMPGVQYVIAPTQRKAALKLASDCEKQLFTADHGDIKQLISSIEQQTVENWPLTS